MNKVKSYLKTVNGVSHTTLNPSAPGSISIRFRNSGSLYDPFNMIFMRMFNKLQNYDPEYHQIHFEEINYAKKLSLKK